MKNKNMYILYGAIIAQLITVIVLGVKLKHSHEYLGFLLSSISKERTKTSEFIKSIRNEIEIS